MKKVNSSPHGWLWGVEDFSGGMIADMVERARELELQVEPEDVTEVLQSHNKRLTDDELLPVEEQRKVISSDRIYSCWR